MTRYVPACLVGLAAVVVGLAALAGVLGWAFGDAEEAAPDPYRPDRAGLTGPEALPARALEFAEPDDGRRVVVRGSGWGHSVGMSQYGAWAMARAGHDVGEILEHYYPGTTILRHPAADRTLRVGLFRNQDIDDRDRLRLTTEGRGGAAPDRPVEVELGGATVHVPLGQVWALRVADDSLALVDADGEVRAEGDAPARVRFDHREGEPALLRLPQLTGADPARAGSFRWGELEVAAVDGEVHPTLVLSVERYLRGLAEMPPSWEPEALKAQALAGRTYAVRSLLAGIAEDCSCHLGTTPHDQAYNGWAHERANGADRWVAAVEATAGEVVTFEGDLAWTYYSSSHGGRTEAAPDSWAYGPEQAQPYLVSVDDPWSLDPEVGNPRATWEVELPAAAVARTVGLVELTDVEISERTDGGSPAALAVSGVDLAGNDVSYAFRGGLTGIAGSDLKLAFREELPSQQITELELVD